MPWVVLHRHVHTGIVAYWDLGLALLHIHKIYDLLEKAYKDTVSQVFRMIRFN